MSEQRKYVIDLSRLNKTDIDLAGGKGAGLGELIRCGFSVPPGFCVTTLAFDLMLEQNGLAALRIETLQSFAEGGLSAAEASERIMKAIADAGLPAEIKHEIEAAAAEIFGDAPFACAVRSSATFEDSPEYSFAGQQDTFLNVRTPEEIVQKVLSCFASLFTERSLAYRKENGLLGLKASNAVVVEQLVDAERSGVLFTINPMGATGEMIINAATGLGEAIVSGRITPDHYVIDRRKPSIKSMEAGDQHFAMRPAEAGGVAKEKIAGKYHGKPVLNKAQTLKLARLGLEIEKAFGAPQDIEWALSAGKFYILQARPITASSKDAGEQAIIWSKVLGEEFWSGVVTPLMFSTVGHLIEEVMILEPVAILGRDDLNRARYLGLFRGRIYVNASVLEEIIGLFPRWSLTDDLLRMFPESRRKIIREKAAWWISPKFIFMLIRLLRGGFPWYAPHRKFYEFVRRDLPKVTMTFIEQGKDNYEQDWKIVERRLADYLRIATWGVVWAYILIPLLQDVTNFFFGRRQAATLLPGLLAEVESNRTLEVNRAVFATAALARKAGLRREELLNNDFPAISKLAGKTPESKQFIDAFGELVTNYGHRSTDRDLCYRRWSDDATIPLRLLALSMDSADISSIAGTNKKAKNKAARLLSRGLWKFLPVRSPMFFVLLFFARRFLGLRENMRFYADIYTAKLRQIFVEVGRKAARDGMIGDEEDIFFLTVDEIFSNLENLRGAPESLLGKRQRRMARLIEERRSNFEKYAARQAPVFLIGSKDYVEGGEKGKSIDGALEGQPASSGRATGKARVISSSADFWKLQPGEILVAAATDPAWTPLFARTAAIVLEVGGFLSHGSILAREYGLPAVVGVAGACSSIAPGAVITVDGDSGRVFIHQDEPTADGTDSTGETSTND
jgi:rifampicin phosphotransferase